MPRVNVIDRESNELMFKLMHKNHVLDFEKYYYCTETGMPITSQEEFDKLFEGVLIYEILNGFNVKEFDECSTFDFCNFGYLVIHNNDCAFVKSRDEFEDLMTRLERRIWRKEDAINPDHYKTYMQDLQWIEAMQLLPTFRDPKVFLGALELQVRKYMDRLNKKDHPLQELKKARWYLDFMIKFIENDCQFTKVK